MFQDPKDSPDGTSLDHARYARWAAAQTGVEGWFSDMSAAIWDALLAQQRAWHMRGDLLEIGCAYGRAALMLGVHTAPPETLRLVEAWPAHAHETPGRVQPHSAGRVEAIEAFSEALPPDALPALGTRFVHVDGDHGRWGLLTDMALADRVTAPDGLVVLDDFLAPQFMGVTLGAIEWLTRNPDRFEFVMVGFNKAYLARPRYAARWLEFIRDAMPAHLRAVGHADFSLWRTDDRRGCPCFGITPRQYDRDFITREFAMALPDKRADGKPEL